MQAAGAVVGMGASIAGGIIGANAADKRRKKLQAIANTPGVDFGKTYSETIGASQSALPDAQRLAGDQNRFNTQQVLDAADQSIPGFSAMQGQRATNAASLLRGDIPDDVARSVYRGAAGRALEGGFGGSPAGRNLAARDLGRTSLDLMGLGSSELEGMLSSTPRARMVQTDDILNIDPKTGLAVRGGERDKRLDMLTGAAMQPGKSDIYAKMLQDMGGQLSGASGGMGSIMGMI